MEINLSLQQALAVTIIIIIIIIILIVVLGSFYRGKRYNKNNDRFFVANDHSNDCPKHLNNYRARDSIEDLEDVEDLENELEALENYSLMLRKALEVKKKYQKYDQKEHNQQQDKRWEKKEEKRCVMRSFDFKKVAANRDFREDDVGYVRLFNAETFVMAGVAAVTLYGYTNDNKVIDLSFSKTPCGEGIGIWDDQFNRFYENDINADRSDEFNYRKLMGWLDDENDMENTHKIDNKHYIQCDVFQLLPYYQYKCKEPTIVIACLKGGFQIGGSNVLGEFGVELFHHINDDEDNIEVELPLFNPGNAQYPITFKYISVRSYPLGKTVEGGHFLLKTIDLQVSD